MQAFKIHSSVVEDYKNYLNSFTLIKDQRIREKVDEAFSRGVFLPEALIQFNPSYKTGESLDSFQGKKLHPELSRIFGSYKLYHHQVEAIRKGIDKESFVVTSGTGSGKSLIFLATIFNGILHSGFSKGTKAIIVYPMNALINSQEEEIKKYEINYLKSRLPVGVALDETDKTLDEVIIELKKLTIARFPVTYGKYTGQENAEKRDQLKDIQPDIILTNYMMLELIMTRNSERWLRESMAETLEYLVFDELHTYRGRQGSDVSLLIRRINGLCKKDLVHIGTSATMASSGSREEKQLAVAKFANLIFDDQISIQNVIGETLDTCTVFPGKIPSGFDLQEAMLQKIDPYAASEKFITNKLAIWLENRIALTRNNDGSLERANPLSLNQIAKELSIDSGESVAICEKIILEILQWSENLNLEGAKQTPRRSYLPIKIHQFISQTGNVYVSLESKDTRKITLETGRYIRVEGNDRPIFPVLFSRYSGYDFICVRKDGNKLLPRNPDDLPPRITKEDLRGDRETKTPRRQLTEADFLDGYIIMPEKGDDIWTEEDEDNLPENWYNKKRTGGKFDNFFEFRLPSKISFDPEGYFSTGNHLPYSGWYIPARLLFDPTSGVIFDLRTNENTKLMRLGNEGRSTATTITSFSIIKSLSEQGVPIRNQKLLSFTDNRQDASLQAGHFNDFLMLGRLRSAIYHSLKIVPENILNIDTICDKVYKTLNLGEEEYARIPSTDPGWPDPENEKAFKDFLLIRILYDLKRGWRYNTPNLEQCGLLEISYYRLEEFCQQDRFFESLELFNKLNPGDRLKILLQILNFFRTSYAFEHHKLLDNRSETEEKLKNRLDENKLWSLDSDEKIDSPYILLPRSVGDTNFRTYTASIGPNSYLGKYLKRTFNKYERDVIKGDELTNYIEALCKVLEKGNFLKSELVHGSKGDCLGYRLRIDQVIWKLGNGAAVMNDEVRTASYREINSKPNDFFRKFYQQDFSEFGRTIIGREHTGQLNNDDRIAREEKFRQGSIAALFCSPTMELGIDISELNVVHMRNVPPNPANYAQRSGRSGRSGQAALVFTYCSNGSPHDRNYFRESLKMVSGVVVPPKIDLTNEELILTHFNAYILMELGINDLHTSVNDALQVVDFPALPLKDRIKLQIQDHLQRYSSRWVTDFKELIKNIPGIDKSSWLTDDWLITHAQSFLNRFDQSFVRWRILYRNARQMVDRSRLIIDDPTPQVDNKKRLEAERQERIGKRQIDLLLNKDNKSFGGESEFYIFRYLASEGFLPGYNFTRLPVRAFLGYRHLDKGEFVSRPRFIAIREFGPNNLIYHNGGKFRISRMQLPQGAISMQSLKVSKTTGYAFLNDESLGINNDPINKSELKGGDFVESFNNLLELTESDAKPQERISCEEEERMSTGFEIDQYFSFSKGIEKTRQITITDKGQPLLQVIYDQSARLIQLNKRWKSSGNEEGFAIGRLTGKWKKARDLETPNADDPSADVRLFTAVNADILYIQPVKELRLDENGVVSLAFSLKRAIERQFQVEEGEIGVWIMGKAEARNLMIYEAAEGSLGILSQLIEDGNALHALFEESYKLLHFDPVTHQDTKPDEPKASYDNLLSYYNQRFHEQLDRYSVKEALERLMNCNFDPGSGEMNYEQQYEYLMKHYDLNSGTEKKLIEYLYKNGYRLPDRAQFNVPGCYVNADFVYKTEIGYSLVFCDGSVHDRVEVRETDTSKRQYCRDEGYDVIEWHYSESIEKFIERRKDIFRKIK